MKHWCATVHLARDLDSMVLILHARQLFFIWLPVFSYMCGCAVEQWLYTIPSLFNFLNKLADVMYGSCFMLSLRPSKTYSVVSGPCNTWSHLSSLQQKTLQLKVLLNAQWPGYKRICTDHAPEFVVGLAEVQLIMRGNQKRRCCNQYKFCFILQNSMWRCSCHTWKCRGIVVTAVSW